MADPYLRTPGTGETPALPVDPPTFHRPYDQLIGRAVVVPTVDDRVIETSQKTQGFRTRAKIK